MAISRFAVRRKVTVLMGTLVLILLGAALVGRLPVDLLPRTYQPAVVVVVAWPGASPADIETSISRPLEQGIASVPAVESVTSSSREGLSCVSVRFKAGTSEAAAVSTLSAQVDQVARTLPAGAGGPLIARVDPGLLPATAVALTGPDGTALRELADGILAEQLRQLPGVGEVTVAGGTISEVVIAVDAAALSAAGISQAELNEAVRSATSVLPGGQVTERGKDFVVRSGGRAQDIDELARVVVGLRASSQGGASRPVLLMDVATIELGTGPGPTRARLNGDDAVVVTVRPAQGASIGQLASRVLAQVAAIAGGLPSGSEIEITLNQAAYDGRALGELTVNLLWGGGLAILVAAAFVLQVGGTILVIASIPIAAAAALAVFLAAGGSINTLSLSAFALVAGVLLVAPAAVQDAIERRIAAGEAAPEASVAGAGDAMGPVVTAWLVMVAGMLPLLFVGGGLRAIFRDFALTTAVATGASALVALVLVPAGMAVFGRPRQPAPVQAGPSAVARSYASLIAAVLRNRQVVLAVALVLLVVGVHAANGLEMAYVPPLDRGEFLVTLQMPPGTAVERTDAAARRVEAAAMSLSEVRYVTSLVGGGGPVLARVQGAAPESDVAGIIVTLVPASYRNRSTRDVMAEVDRLVWLPGAQLSYTELPAVAAAGGGALLPGAGGSNDIEIVVRGPALETLQELAQSVLGALTGVEGLTGLQATSSRGQPELIVKYDIQRLARHGLTPSEAAAQLRQLLAGESGGQIEVAGSSEIAVVIRHGSQTTLSVSDLGAAELSTPQGGLVRVDEVASITSSIGIDSIERVGGQRTVTVTAGVSGRSLAAVVDDVQAAVERLALPAGYSASLAGEGAAYSSDSLALLKMLLVGLGLVYAVLAARYESLLQPLAVLAALPLALAAAACALRLISLPVSLVTGAGLALLCCTVAGQATLVVDLIRQLRERGLARDVAVSAAGRDRLRPVVFGALASGAAAAPLALRRAEASELVAPMAVALIVGCLVGAFLSLTVVPAAYCALDDLAGRFRRPGRDPLDISDLVP